ncbi:MAG: GatB/YqeY domain-containing protein [Ilumatobacteraceae bacterium]
MTSLKEQLKSDLTVAMKARQEAVTSTLRMVLSAVMNAEVAGDSAKVLSDEQVLEVLRSELKKRLESAEIYEGAGRAEAALSERAEAAIIEVYLPAAMADEELGKIVDEEVANAMSSGATGGKAMGVVVKAVRVRVGALADGAKIAALVKAALS